MPLLQIDQIYFSYKNLLFILVAVQGFSFARRL